MRHIATFNAWLATKITVSVGTMWCAYLFAVLGIMGIVGALSHNTGLVLIVGAVSGYFLQLVLLPVIMVGQNVQGDAVAQKIDETHTASLAEFELAKEQRAAQARNDEANAKAVEDLTALMGDVHELLTEVHKLVKPKRAPRKTAPAKTTTSRASSRR